MRGGVILNSIYLNGKIADRHRKVFTGNGAVAGFSGASKDTRYFDMYYCILVRYLEEKNNALYSMSSYKIFNPFGCYTYSS